MQDRHLFAGMFGEFLAVLLFVFFGIAAVTASAEMAGQGMGAAQKLYIALAHGLMIMLLVSVFGSVSGGHVNPAVTFGLFCAGKISAERLMLYIIGQLVGAAAGAELAALLIPNALQGGLGMHGLAAGLSVNAGFIIEMLISLILVLTVCMTAAKNNTPSVLAPISIGTAVCLGILATITVTGGSMNPARSLGPAFISFVNGCGTPPHQWIYGLAPLTGAMVAAGFFGRLRHVNA